MVFGSFFPPFSPSILRSQLNARKSKYCVRVLHACNITATALHCNRQLSCYRVAALPRQFDRIILWQRIVCALTRQSGGDRVRVNAHAAPSRCAVSCSPSSLLGRHDDIDLLVYRVRHSSVYESSPKRPETASVLRTGRLHEFLVPPLTNSNMPFSKTI